MTRKMVRYFVSVSNSNTKVISDYARICRSKLYLFDIKKQDKKT